MKFNFATLETLMIEFLKTQNFSNNLSKKTACISLNMT